MIKNFQDLQKTFESLNDRQKFLVKTASLGLAITVLIVVVFLPRQGQIRTLKLQYQALEGQLELAHQIIQKNEKLTLRGPLINPDEVSKAIKKLTQRGKDFNMQFLSINPQMVEELPEFQCARLPIQMKLKGTYQDFALFLGALKDVGQMVVNVRKFDLSRQEDASALLNIDLTLEIFLKGKAGG